MVCHRPERRALFEEGLFDETLLINLINSSSAFLKKNANDEEVIGLLIWVVSGVEQCFLSNNDKHDLYVIKNYNVDMEKKWHDDWKPKIIKLTGHNLKP